MAELDKCMVKLGKIEELYSSLNFVLMFTAIFMFMLLRVSHKPVSFYCTAVSI